jgi:hypothetical protein
MIPAFGWMVTLLSWREEPMSRSEYEGADVEREPHITEADRIELRRGVESATELVTKVIGEGRAEFQPVLRELRAFERIELDRRSKRAFEAVFDSFPYQRDRTDWVPVSGLTEPLVWRPSFLELARRGAHASDSDPDRPITLIWNALTEIWTFLDRVLDRPSPEELRAKDPVQSTLDVGTHRLYLIKEHHAGGVVVDDGWYVPAGRVRKAVAIGDPDYLIVASELADARSALFLVDPRNHRFAPVAHLARDVFERIHLDKVEGAAADGFDLRLSPRASGAPESEGERYRVRYGELRWTVCSRR